MVIFAPAWPEQRARKRKINSPSAVSLAIGLALIVQNRSINQVREVLGYITQICIREIK